MKVEENQDVIEILGAREHNLKNIDLTIPRNKLVVFTGFLVQENHPWHSTPFLQKVNVDI
jgi:hypothetical protein